MAGLNHSSSRTGRHPTATAQGAAVEGKGPLLVRAWSVGGSSASSDGRVLHVTAPGTLQSAIARAHEAADAFMRGDPEPLKAMYAPSEEVTLANPFGPPVRGWLAVTETMDRAAAHYRDGRATAFERVAAHLASELACIVELEHFESRVGGGEEIVAISLRVTTVFRHEDGDWKIVHRHADPITTARSPESLVGFSSDAP
jgi:ketosteroid isomerase-like protein